MLWTLVLSLFIRSTYQYLPGVSPKVYSASDEIPLKTLNLNSHHTQIPYDFYFMPYCRPDKIVKATESLGELLQGDSIKNTPLTIRKNFSGKCSIICSKTLSAKDVNRLIYLIENKYHVHWLLDNLPSVHRKQFARKNNLRKGFAIGRKYGFQNEDIYELFNHVNLTVRYHPRSPGADSDFTIVGFEVESMSSSDSNCHLNNSKKTFFRKGDAINTTFSYLINFEESKLSWYSRWEPYARINTSTMHWFSFVNSVVPVVTLTLLIAFILSRVLKKDFFRYNLLSQDPESQLEETGWKLVHGDVFRPPKHSTLFCVLVGTGFQIMGMVVILIVLMLVNFVNLSHNGSVSNAFLFLFLMMAYFGGFFSSVTNKIFGRENYKLIAFYSSLLYPGINFGIFIVLEFLLWTQGSSGAVSFLVLLQIVFIWLLVSVPLSIYGAYMGQMSRKIELSAKPSLIPRQIPRKRNPFFTFFRIALAGAVAFMSAIIEIYYLMNSIWLDRFYFMLGGLVLIFLILTVISCELAIIMCYLQLCDEDYNWWWNSFLTAGSVGVYLFLYGFYYGVFNLHISHVIPFVLYLGYMTLLSLALFILMGTIGVCLTFVFVNKIYGSIKID